MEDLGTGIWWSNTYPQPEGAQEALDRADSLYEQLVNTVNWSRIVLEAMARCADHVDTDDEPGWLIPYPCGLCIRDALLVSRTTERLS